MKAHIVWKVLVPVLFSGAYEELSFFKKPKNANFVICACMIVGKIIVYIHLFEISHFLHYSNLRYTGGPNSALFSVDILITANVNKNFIQVKSCTATQHNIKLFSTQHSVQWLEKSLEQKQHSF